MSLHRNKYGVSKLKLRHFKPGTLRRALVAMAAFASLGGAWLLTQSSALTPLPPPLLYVTPVSGTFAPGAPFSVQVRTNSSTTNVNAVQAELTYPAALLEVVSIDATASAYATQAESTIGTDRVIIARGTVGGTSVAGDQLVATVNFRTKSTTGAAALAFTEGSQLIETTGNTDMIAGNIQRTAGASFQVDATPPTVTLTTPANGSTVANNGTIAVTAAASDSLGTVTAVEIYINNAKAATLTTAPYTYNWSTAGLTLGSSHTLQARAMDDRSNSSSSLVTTVTIADKTPPTVSITTPAAGAAVRGTVTLTASAADNTSGSGVGKVEFYVGGAKVGEDTTSPFTADWNSALAADGNISLTAIAYDRAVPPNTTTSTAVAIRVDNTPPASPTGLRTTTVASNSIALAWNASTDTSGISGYRIVRSAGGVSTTFNVAGNVLAYTDQNLSAGTNYTYFLTALDGPGNVSTAVSLTASTASAKPGDANGDNAVNLADLSVLLSNWNKVFAACDFNKNGKVDLIDLSMLLSNWGK